MVGKRLLPGGVFRKGALHFIQLDFQGPQLVQGVFQVGALLLGLGQQTGAVVAAAVFQLPQSLFQPGPVAAFVPGGDQGVEPAAQGVVLGHRQLGLADEAGPLEHAALHPQKKLAAVGSVQLRHLHAGVGLIGPEGAQGDTALGGPLNGDVPALPVQVDPPGHGASRPGGVALLVRQTGAGGLGPGVQPVEHGQQKGAPGAFAPFVGGMDHVQPGL